MPCFGNVLRHKLAVQKIESVDTGALLIQRAPPCDSESCSLDSQVTQRQLSGQTLLLCPCVRERLEKQEALVSDTLEVSGGSGLLGEVTQHRASEKAFTASNGS